LSNLKNVSGKIAAGEGSVGRMISDTALYENLVSVLDRTTRVLAEIQRNQKEILSKLSSTLDNTANITSKIDDGGGSLGQMVNDKKLYENNRFSRNLSMVQLRF